MNKSTKDEIRKGFASFVEWRGGPQRVVGMWEIIFGAILLSLVMGISLLLWHLFG
jgi:hypothetical protein